MRIIHLDDLTVFDARGDFIRAVHTLMPKMSLQSHQGRYQRRPVIEDYAQGTGLEGSCMLFAHGGSRLKKPLSIDNLLKFDKNQIFEWVYGSNMDIHSVQEWINQFDGKYLALFLDVCNPLNLDVQSKSSILFAPDYIYSTMTHGNSGDVRMFIPGMGYYNDVPERKIGVMEFLAEIYRMARRELKDISQQV